MFFTRLHVRYARETHPQDLQFHVTPNREHFQGRYILTNPAKGDLSCDDGQRYLAGLIKNRANELEELYALTSWNTHQYSNYIQEYYGLLKDKSLLNEVDEKRNELIPGFQPKDKDPNNWLKWLVLVIISLLMVKTALKMRKLRVSN